MLPGITSTRTGYASKIGPGRSLVPLAAEPELWSTAKVQLTRLRARKVEEEGVRAEYPAHRGLGQMGQLVLGYPGLQDSQGVQQAHGGDHGAPSAQHHEPCLGPALGVRRFVVVCLDVVGRVSSYRKLALETRTKLDFTACFFLSFSPSVLARSSPSDNTMLLPAVISPPGPI